MNIHRPHLLVFLACWLPLALHAAGHPLAEARDLAVRGSFAEAQFQYARVLQREPAHREALFELGMLQARHGQVDPAGVQLERLRRACGQCTEAQRLAEAITQRSLELVRRR